MHSHISREIGLCQGPEIMQQDGQARAAIIIPAKYQVIPMCKNTLTSISDMSLLGVVCSMALYFDQNYIAILNLY